MISWYGIEPEMIALVERLTHDGCSQYTIQAVTDLARSTIGRIQAGQLQRQQAIRDLRRARFGMPPATINGRPVRRRYLDNLTASLQRKHPFERSILLDELKKRLGLAGPEAKLA